MAVRTEWQADADLDPILIPGFAGPLDEVTSLRRSIAISERILDAVALDLAKPADAFSRWRQGWCRVHRRGAMAELARAHARLAELGVSL